MRHLLQSSTTSVVLFAFPSLSNLLQKSETFTVLVPMLLSYVYCNRPSPLPGCCTCPVLQNVLHKGSWIISTALLRVLKIKACHRTSLCIFVMSKGPFSEEMLPPTPPPETSFFWSHGHPTVRVLESCTAPIQSDDTFTSDRATPWKENANFRPCRRCLLYPVVICCYSVCCYLLFHNVHLSQIFQRTTMRLKSQHRERNLKTK